MSFEVRKDNALTYGRGLVLPSKDFDSKLNYSNTIFYDPKSSTTTSVNKSTFGKPAVRSVDALNNTILTMNTR